METSASFGYWMRRQRKVLDLTQQALANRVGYSVAAIKKIESDERRPSREMAERLADYLSIPSDQRERFIESARGIRPVDQMPLANEPALLPRQHSNLPSPLTSFIGRKKEIQQVKHLISRARLVTITGPGGVGKTRLAIQAAFALQVDFQWGASIAELAPLSDESLVPAAIVAALDSPGDPLRPPLSILTDYLREKSFLLLLDNCEHLIESCAQLSRHLLAHCPDLKILATSREPLGLDGEEVMRLPSLELPSDEPTVLRELNHVEAVQLFLDRARAVYLEFALTEANAVPIIQVCRWLDGIPLAIELAASRVPFLKVEQIAARLEHALHLLTTGSRTALPRHQTLRAAIEWSYNLLSSQEQVFLRSLSVFSGGWTLEAAFEIGAVEGLGEIEVFDLLTELVNKSLVGVNRQQGEEARYTMLITIRQYAQEKLEESGRVDTLCGAHAGWCLNLSEQADRELHGPDQEMWLARLDIEQDNLRAALDWSLQRLDAGMALDLSGALAYYWDFRARLMEGINWLEKALAFNKQTGLSKNKPQRIRALLEIGTLESIRGNHETAVAWLQEAEFLAREQDDQLRLSRTLAWLGFEWTKLGDFQKATLFLEESLALARFLGDKPTTSLALRHWANVEIEQSNFAIAQALLEESLALDQEHQDKSSIAKDLNILAKVAFFRGDYPNSRNLFEQQLSLCQTLGDRNGIISALNDMALVAQNQGDVQTAIDYFQTVLAGAREIGRRNTVAIALVNLGYAALNQRDYVSSRKWLEQCLDITIEIGETRLFIIARYNLGLLALELSDLPQARREFVLGLKSARQENSPLWISYGLLGLACAASDEVLNQALRLAAAIKAILDKLGASLEVIERRQNERLLERASQALGEEAFSEAWQAGSVLNLEQAIELAQCLEDS